MYAVEMQTKVCEGPCGLDLSIDRFYSHKKGGHSALCRICTVADNKLRRRDPEAHRLALNERKEKKAAVKAAALAVITEKACTKCGAIKKLVQFREHRGLYGRASWCLACERQYTREWTEENREWWNAHRRETWANTEFTQEERDEAAERAREWYANNTARHRESFYRWVEQNPEAFRAIQARRRGRKAEVLSTLTENDWLTILEVFNYSCAWCLRDGLKMTMDHVIPISKGGEHTAENIVPACGPCNSRKKDRRVFCMLNKRVSLNEVVSHAF